MSTGASLHARVDQLLLDLGRGLDHDVLLEIHGQDNWNAALLLASAGRQQSSDKVNDGLDGWEIPDDILFDAMAHRQTETKVLAQALVHRGWRVALEGGFAQRFASQAITQLRERGVRMNAPQSEAAWLALGKTHSQQAKDPNYQGLGWTQVDAADHLLAALEPHIGVAPQLRKWACSNDCALPNTLVAFRRGQLRINAARARGDFVEKDTRSPDM